jgi:hypothetical protein
MWRYHKWSIIATKLTRPKARLFAFGATKSLLKMPASEVIVDAVLFDMDGTHYALPECYAHTQD